MRGMQAVAEEIWRIMKDSKQKTNGIHVLILKFKYSYNYFINYIITKELVMKLKDETNGVTLLLQDFLGSIPSTGAAFFWGTTIIFITAIGVAFFWTFFWVTSLQSTLHKRLKRVFANFRAILFSVTYGCRASFPKFEFREGHFIQFWETE